MSTILSNQVTPHAGCTLVIFGASGDLAKKKLYPSLYQLYKQKLLPQPFHVVGYSRTKMTDEQFREKLCASHTYEDTSFFSHISYISGESYSDEASLAKLSKAFETHSQNRIFYLSLPPAEFRNVCSGLKKAKLITQNSGSKENAHTIVGREPFTRIVFEKPFGSDYTSALKLKKFVSNHFENEQIFPVDHYLGKEPLQNVLYFRFANSVFENLWNGRYIDHMQITLNEDIRVEKRAGYFDNNGIMRDMVQSHALQVLALSCMEPPSVFTADAIRAEKTKFLQLLQPFEASDVMMSSGIIRAQYENYLQEEGVAPDSKTETLVAFRVPIHNWRWSGMPVYIRTGKALSRKCAELVVHFKDVLYNIFGNAHTFAGNKLIFRFQPDTFLKFSIQTKVPVNDMILKSTNMNFLYSDEFKDIDYSNGYDRILHSALANDGTLFLSQEEILAQWKFSDSILNEWHGDKYIPLYNYKIGSEGPQELHELMHMDNRAWNND